jgi:hypothetical protein
MKKHNGDKKMKTSRPCKTMDKHNGEKKEEKNPSRPCTTMKKHNGKKKNHILVQQWKNIMGTKKQEKQKNKNHHVPVQQ